MRRLVLLLLATTALAGTAVVVASGSKVAAHKAPRPRLGQSLPLLAQLERLKSAPATPQSCSVAAGPCVEGCARPVAGAIVTPRLAFGLCPSSSMQPCFELIARPPGSARANFCAAASPPRRVFESFSPKAKRRR